MLLVELHLQSGTRRASNEALATDSYFWEPDIASLSQFRFSMDRLYGGYVRPQFGKVELLPTAFENDWPPPTSFSVTVYWADDDDEASYKELLDGTAYITEQKRDGIVYDMYERGYSYREVDKVYDGTISGAGGIFDTSVSAIPLNSDYTLGDGVNAPYISFTDSGDKLILNGLSDVCAVGTHMFYRVGSTMYLVDMFTDNGAREITEFDFFSVQYRYNAPYSDYRCGDYSVAGESFASRDMTIAPVFNTAADAETQIITGLTRIKQILDMPQITVKMPITQGIPNFGENVSFVDESGMKPISAWLRVRGMVIDFDSDQVVLTGDGGVS